MAIVKWNKKSYDPFKEFFDWERPFLGLTLSPFLEKKLSSQGEGWYPAVDVSEDDKNVIVKADLPGLNKEDISLSVDNSILTLRGERKSEVEKKDKNYYRAERSYGVFERQIDLGSAVDDSQAEAKYHDGVLEVTLPKKKELQKKTIDIK